MGTTARRNGLPISPRASPRASPPASSEEEEDWDQGQAGVRVIPGAGGEAKTVPIMAPLPFTHRGPWDDRSRAQLPLKFIETYIDVVDSTTRAATSSSKFYAPMAIYHDTKGDVHLTGHRIWACIGRQLSPFASVRHEAVELIVTADPDGRHVVHGEFLTHFRLKGDEEDILVPRMLIWTLGASEGDGGTEGLQIHELKQYWDTAIIGRYVSEKKKREQRKRHWAECDQVSEGGT